MDQHFPYWLSKQMIIGVKGFNMDAYLVALEGWRRGLTLKWHYDAADVTNLKIIGFNPLGKTLSLRSKKKTHFFYRSRGDKVENNAVDIASDKVETKKCLAKANIPHPEGIYFSTSDNNEEVIQSALSLGFPLVIKPTFGSLGKGVITNIQTESELRKCMTNLRSDVTYSDFIIEYFFSGYDLRIYVAGDNVLAATKRVPANVVGDGVHSIEELIQLKNDTRKENPYLATKLIKPDDEVEEYLFKRKRTLTSIPNKGEVIYLKGKSNISAGGDPVDYTEEITEEVKRMAIQAVQSIPGLTHAGVDLIVTENKAIVIEINATADIGMHVFPFIGQARHIPQGIIDYYFPETIGLASNRTKIYFDYQRINRLMQNMLVKEVQITDAPKGELYAKRYVISGKVQKVGYRSWVRREALKRNLNGYTRNLRNGRVVVVVGGSDKEQVNNFKIVCYKGPRRANVEEIKEFVWESQIKSGFEIRNTNKEVKSNAGKRQKGNTAIKNEDNKVTLTAVGDILLHGRVYGGTNKKSGYNFHEQLNNISGLLGQTDITIANLETVIGGNEIGLSSFPRFNAPVEIGYALKDLGVDIVSIANNHVLDKGEKGLLKSIENLETIGLEYDGAYKSSEDKERLRIFEKNGLKICFISYTSGTNGIKIPESKPHLVNSLRQTSTLRIVKELRRIKRENLADVIIVNLHVGEEYHLNPSNFQKELAAHLSDAGADVILGHHPHVLQPPEWIENSRGTRTFVAYSLGNFFSGQNGLHRQVGASLTLEITKPNKNYKEIVIKKLKFNLTFVNREERLRYDIYLFQKWMQQNEFIETIDGKFSAKNIYEGVRNRMRTKIKDLEIF